MRIDIAHFTCGTCGHRSTPPDVVNTSAHEMEVFEKVPLKVKFVDGAPVYESQIPDKAKKKGDLEKKFKGNKVTIRVEGNEEVVRLERSYSKVAQQDTTELTEAKHVVLSCPECDEILYEVTQR